MTEAELRQGLREVIANSGQRSPMDGAAMLDAARGVARRARRRRRTIWAAMGATAGVVLIAVGATVALSGGRYTSGPAGPAGSPPPVTGTAGASATPTQTSREGTETVWPTGPDGKPQQDRTASAGPRYQEGARLLDKLIALVPPGYTPGEDAATVTSGRADAAPDRYRPPARSHQAQFAERVNGIEVWEYLALLEVSQGPATGRLLAEVHTPGNSLPTDPCALTKSLWGMGGTCQVLTANGQQVGVVVAPTGDPRFDQWAAFRHGDGTVIFIGQAKSVFGFNDRPSLAALPFTPQQLAEAVTAFSPATR